MSRRAANVLLGNSPNAIDWAVQRLRDGGVIVFPTDTVYGLAAMIDQPEQLARIYRIKGRPDEKPLPILVSSSAAAQSLTNGLSEEQALLLDRYWPGPLTVVVPAHGSLPREVRASDGTIGLRSPNHPLALAVIAQAGGALACTSANRSGSPPARDASEAAESLGSDVDLILDGGATPGGLPSTVVGFDGERLIQFRAGPIPLEHVQTTWDALRSGQGGGED